MSDHLVALIPLSHPLASSPSITLQQLKNDRFCFIKEGSLMYQMSMDACQNAGFIPDIIFTSHRIDSIFRYGNQPKLCCTADGRPSSVS